MQPQYGGGQWGYPPQPQPGMYPNTGSPPVGQAGYPGAFPQHQNPGYAHAPVMPDQQPPAVGYPHVVQPAAPTNVDAWIAQNAQGYNPTPAPQQSYGQPATAAGSNTQPKSADTAPAVPQQGPAVVVNARFEASENAKLGLMASIDEIQAKYGHGVRGYFLFTRAMALLNAILFVPAVIGYFVAVSNKREPSYHGISQLFLGAYPSSALRAWKGTSVVLLFLFIACGLLGRFWYASKIAVQEDHDVAADDSIPENRLISYKKKYWRRVGSIFACFCMIGTQGAVVYGIQKGLASKGGQVVSVIISVLTTASHVLWTILTKKATEFEKHDTMTARRNWDFNKLLLLKLANVVVIYLVKERVAKSDNLNVCLDPTVVDCACPLRSMGYQFFYLLVTDMTVGNVGTIVMAFLKWKVLSRVDQCRKISHGDDHYKETFDVAQEHVQLLYRQFLIVLGSFVFPLITIFAVAANLLEIFWDKLRLVYLCKRPLHPERPIHTKSIVTYFTLIFLLSLLTYPNGMVWILRGDNQEACQVWA